MGDKLTTSWRGQKGTAAERGYGWRWQKARGAYLRLHPLCVMCTAERKVVLATVVDHVTPHRGDQGLFWDVGNWQALCAPHHNTDKQQLEKSGTERTRFDATGRVIW